MGLTRTHQRQISLKHTRKHKTHAINQPFPAHESQPPRPLFSVSPISGGRKKAAPNTYKWILKINLKKNVPWRVRFFLTLRYRSWAGGVTATTHVTRENLSAFRRVLRELLQVNISLLERQTPQKSSHAPIHTKGSL